MFCHYFSGDNACILIKKKKSPLTDQAVVARFASNPVSVKLRFCFVLGSWKTCFGLKQNISRHHFARIVSFPLDSLHYDITQKAQLASLNDGGATLNMMFHKKKTELVDNNSKSSK